MAGRSLRQVNQLPVASRPMAGNGSYQVFKERMVAFGHLDIKHLYINKVSGRSGDFLVFFRVANGRESHAEAQRVAGCAGDL